MSSRGPAGRSTCWRGGRSSTATTSASPTGCLSLSARRPFTVTRPPSTMRLSVVRAADGYRVETRIFFASHTRSQLRYTLSNDRDRSCGRKEVPQRPRGFTLPQRAFMVGVEPEMLARRAGGLEELPALLVWNHHVRAT